jgi:hypothetical protein
MLELNIKCESLQEARMYLSAQQYHSLISDLYMALHGACKHGTDKDVLRVVETFMPDMYTAIEHSEGAY